MNIITSKFIAMSDQAGSVWNEVKSYAANPRNVKATLAAANENLLMGGLREFAKERGKVQNFTKR